MRLRALRFPCFAIACALALAAGTAAAATAPPLVETNPLAPPVTRIVVIDGRVTSTGNAPVARADVRLVRGGAVAANTLSDAQGRYRFSNAAPSSGIAPLVPPGRYAIEAQYRGTVKAGGTVTVRGDTTVHRNIALGAIVQLGGASTTPRPTMIVTDRVPGEHPVPLAGAFTNDRPILACAPAPGCALHFGIVRPNGPILPGVEVAPDVDSFVTLMRSAYPSATSLTIFVHGFNNDFSGPVRLTATAVASVDPQGVPLAYSWPSKSATAKYLDDETNNAWGAEHFRDFLVALMTRSDAPATVNIVAHSMGNRLAVSALTYLARAKPVTAAHVGAVVFAAPDVDAATFWEAVPLMASVAGGLTVYESTHDEALQLSRELHGHCRAGLWGCNDAAALPANVNAIDTSFFRCDLIGHGYWAASTTVLADIAAVVSGGPIAPGAAPRAHLASAGSPGRFRFVSTAADDRGCAADPPH